MSSQATFNNPDSGLPRNDSVGEASPLLGDASSGGEDVMPDKRTLLGKNLFGGGRALLTQIGCLALLLPLLYIIIKNPAGLFSYHPPLQALAIILFTQGILTLQPTKSKPDKQRGLALHSVFQILGLSAIVAGISVMIYNKVLHGANHFTSWHGKFGLATSLLLIMQALIGITVAWDPTMRLLGGETKAKSLWKYHRASGYLTLPLALLTASLATTRADWILQHTNFAERLAMTAGLAFIAVGLWSRMSLQKLGVKTA